jgi:hypothetical protein
VRCRIKKRNEESRGLRKESLKMDIRDSGIMAEEQVREGRALLKTIREVLNLIKNVTV